MDFNEKEALNRSSKSSKIQIHSFDGFFLMDREFHCNSFLKKANLRLLVNIFEFVVMLILYWFVLTIIFILIIQWFSRTLEKLVPNIVLDHIFFLKIYSESNCRTFIKINNYGIKTDFFKQILQSTIFLFLFLIRSRLIVLVYYVYFWVLYDEPLLEIKKSYSVVFVWKSQFLFQIFNFSLLFDSLIRCFFFSKFLK